MTRSDFALVGAAAIAATGLAVVAYAYTSKGGGGTLLAVSIGATDVSGVPLSGVVISLGTNTAITDSTGEVLFQGIIPGPYTLSATALGFNPISESVTVSKTDFSFQVQMTVVGSCTPQSCPCGQAWNSISCSCVPQRLASLTVDVPTYSFNQSWLVRWIPGSSICGSAVFSPTCPTCTYSLFGGLSCPDCPSPRLTSGVQLRTQVLDVNGNPVCGVAVSAGFPNILLTIPFSGDLGNLSGQFQLSLDHQMATTDQFGFADFIINIDIVNLKNTEGCPFSPCTGNATYSIPFSVEFSTPGLPSAFSSIDMIALICAIGSLT